MKKPTPQLRQEVEGLLTRSTVAEATGQVWKHYQTALEGLSPDARSLLEAHFDGASVERLAEQSGLAPEDVRNCLEQAKRQLLQGLRSAIRLRQ